MPRTRTDLVVEALDNLSVTQVGQEPSAEDRQKVDDKIDGLFAFLASKQVLYVADPDAIEDEYFNSLGIMLANRCAVAFGSSYDPSVDEREMMNLRLVQRRPGGYAPMQSDYF